MEQIKLTVEGEFPGLGKEKFGVAINPEGLTEEEIKIEFEKAIYALTIHLYGKYSKLKKEENKCPDNQ